MTATFTVAYSGPMPDRPIDYYRLAEPAPNRRFVYDLLSVESVHVYIGRSWQPGTRFDKHRNRPWWEFVRHVDIYQIEAPTPGEAEAFTNAHELNAIRHFRPVFNIAGLVN